MSEDSAWQECFDRYGSDIYTFLCYSLPTAQDAEDVLSDTWMGLIGAISKFDEKATLRTYIFSVARKKVVDFWRKNERYKKQIPMDTLFDSLTLSGPTSKALEIQEAFSALPEKYQEVLLLSYVMGLSVAEIAGVMGGTYKAVEGNLSRARKKLSENLGR